jgi:hypothetical protein
MSERISIKPDVCNGRPVVRITCITVQTVLEFLAAGDLVEDARDICRREVVFGRKVLPYFPVRSLTNRPHEIEVQFLVQSPLAFWI